MLSFQEGCRDHIEEDETEERGWKAKEWKPHRKHTQSLSKRIRALF